MVVMSLLGWPCSSWRAGFRVPGMKMVIITLLSLLSLVTVCPPENVPEYTPLPWWCMLSMMAPRPLCRFRPCRLSLPELEPELELELELLLALLLLLLLVELLLLLLLGEGV